MRPITVLRLGTLALACVHAFPAQKHLLAFFEKPSLEEAWKGFGALVAIALYLLPVAVQARGLTQLWRGHRVLLRVAGVLLAAVHAVPASDHLPRLAQSFAWGDGWRGLGSAIAVAWFLAPVRLQRKVIVVLARSALVRPEGPANRGESTTRGGAHYSSV
jgi:hypothetical protein